MMTPTHIVIHCSDSPRGRGDTAETIHRWHLDRGWTGIGYHFVIRDNGYVEAGRPPYWTGAHCRPLNEVSIGVCIIGLGEDDFSVEQIDAAVNLVRGLMVQYDIPLSGVIGHYEGDPGGGKTCPNYPMDDFRNMLS
jgi:N-acetylmuramoyl-L-alanine amidase